MKKLLILIAMAAAGPAFGQTAPQNVARTATAPQVAPNITEPRERLTIATDKDNYISGELVWFKIVTTTVEGVPMTFSKVGYVEIVGPDGSVARERLNLRNGIGNGTVILPAGLPTGYYRLVGYTRWMRNEGPEVFFAKTIGVVNPASAEVPRGDDSAAGPASAVPAVVPTAAPTIPTGNLTVAASGGGVYSPRSEVRLTVAGIPDDVFTLSVSVTGRDATGGFTRPAPDPRPTVSVAGLSTASLPAFSGRYIAEYEGPVITGKLIDTGSDTPGSFSGAQPVLSFPGEAINLFPGRLDSSGNIIFRTSRIAGFDEVAATIANPTLPTGGPYRIDLDDPYTTRDLTRPLPTFPLERLDRESLMNQSLSMQLQYAYVNDSLSRGIRPAPQFFRPPDYSYRMDEWRRFATMPEVVTEFLKMLRFVREDGRQQLSIANLDFPSVRTRPIVLIDGVPIIDHDIVAAYNPLLLKRIDVYYDRYLFGDDLFYGIVALYTTAGGYPELQPDPFTRILPYAAPSAERVFYSPDHSSTTGDGTPGRTNRLPDYRHTLYRDADLASEGGRAEVSFYTSDLTGSYRVMIEGLTRSGQPLCAIVPIEVR